MSRWRIEMLGGLRVVRDECAITRFRSHQTGALLAYLAFFPNRAHRREHLIAMLWPEAEETAGRNSLSVALSSLRELLEKNRPDQPPLFEADRHNITLRGAAIETDVAAFLKSLSATRGAPDEEAARHFVTALKHYGGPLLPGYDHEWISSEARRLEELSFRALRRLIALQHKAGNPNAALQWAQRGVALDPTREDTQRDLIRTYAATGQYEAALRQGQELQRVLRDRLDATPTPSTTQLLREIARRLAQQPAARSTESLAAQSTLSGENSLNAGARRGLHRVPPQWTRFFGRETERAQLMQWLRDEDIGLIVLTGPGGSGKTRLAIELAREIDTASEEAFPGGVWWASLAELTDAQRVPDAIGEILQIAPSPTPVLEAVVKVLCERPALLVLDNFEHLLPRGAACIQTLLEHIPHAKILITSRHKLHLSAEREWLVSPLPIPNVSGKAPRIEATDVQAVDDEAAFAGVALFCDRARLARPGFAIDQANRAAILALCRRLEGLPLALELAAARIGVLSPAQILSHLESGSTALRSPHEDTSPRHRTLRATIEWSYRLLSPELQEFWTRLSVFRGGWTPEAAQHACTENSALDLFDVLDRLAQLCDSSLVVAAELPVADNHALPVVRFRLLEMMREFAGEQLTIANRERVCRQHAEYFLGQAERAEDLMVGPQQEFWMAHHSIELENFRAALSWAMKTDAGLGTRLAVRLAGFWERKGYLSEGGAWLETALAADDIDLQDRHFHLRALVEAGRLAYLRGDFVSAEPKLRRGVEAFAANGDEIAQAWAMCHLGTVQTRLGQVGEARELLDASLQLGHKYLHRPLLADTLTGLASLAVITSDLELLNTVAAEKLTLQRALKNSRGIAFALIDVGLCALAEDDLPRAHALFEESLKGFQALSEPWGMGQAFMALGATARRRGDFEAARTAYRQSLDAFQQAGNTWEIIALLDQFGYLAHQTGHDERAVLLLSAAQNLRETARIHLPPLLARGSENEIQVLREIVPPDRFSLMWQKGQLLDLEHAIALALNE